MKLNIIGAGNLGKTLGKLLFTKNPVEIGGVINQTPESSHQAVQFIGTGKACQALEDLPEADLFLIATPDNRIQQISMKLCEAGIIRTGNIVFHCSGALTSDILACVHTHNAHAASIHPMRSFSSPEHALTHYEGTCCAMEGDPQAVAQLEPLFNQAGSITFPINKAQKSMYHAAGVFSSNYLVTLADQAIQCLEASGVDPALSTNIVLDIMEGTVNNLKHTRNTKLALTGPLKRGDTDTVQSHLNALPGSQRKLYSELAHATLALTDLDDLTQNSIINML